MKNLWTYCKIPLESGTTVRFCLWIPLWNWCFVHDLILTDQSRKLLALNALWGMPLIFGSLGLGLGLVIALIAWIRH